MRFFVLFALFLLALFALSACGQKGPLYLRDKPPPGVKPERPAPYKPVPYPADDSREEK